MRFYWQQTGHSLGSHSDWRDRITKKNRRQGTSAPTIAAAWAGPIEVLGALRKEPTLAEAVFDRVVVERQSHFDGFGGPRNHDLVLSGSLPDGDGVVVCVEAKAGETLGETVEQYARAAEGKRARGEATNAPERLQGLVDRYMPNFSRDDESVRLMRYQFLSALAGTEAEAASSGAKRAVLMVHEFLTDQRKADVTVKQAQDLHRFCTTVFDCEPPGAHEVPWCFEVPAPATIPARLYLAWAVTDLRTVTLEA